MDLLKVVQTESLEKIEEIVGSKSIPINSKWIDYAMLNSALECGRVDVAKFLLEKKCRVNKSSKKSIEPANTPLHHAIKLGDLDLIRSLLDKKASVTAVNADGDTPLHVAFMTRQEKIVDAILDHIDSTLNYENMANSQGLTHMHIACTRKNGKIVDNFIGAGIDLNDSINADSALWPGYRAIHFAVQFESLEAAMVLKKASNQTNVEDGNGDNPLKLAYEKLKDLTTLVHIFSQESMSVDSPQHKQLSFFHMACLRDDPVAVENFIKNGADVNLPVSRDAVFCPLYTPLHFAVEGNCKRIVELLLAHGADVEAKNDANMTPLHLALYNEDHNQRDTIVDLLYEAVPDKEADNSDDNHLTYFHVAITRNNLRLVKKFLAKNPDDVNNPILYNVRKFAHYTPLHFSVLYGHAEMTELLIKRGCNYNRTDTGWHGAPLHLAIATGRKAIVDLLLDKGARVNVLRSYDDRTTLHLLVEFCLGQPEDDSYLGYIERLVKLGCDLNAKDVDGNTALHLACSQLYNGGECARLLLELGADVDLENEAGKTPFNVSFYLGSEVDIEDYMMLYEHVQKLKALGLKVNPKNEVCCEIFVQANPQLNESGALTGMQQEIQDEIAKLKGVKFNKRVTLLDFLLFDAKRLATYVHNDVIKKAVESDDLDEQYPKYAYLLKLQYQRGMELFGADEVEKADKNARPNKRRRVQ